MYTQIWISRGSNVYQTLRTDPYRFKNSAFESFKETKANPNNKDYTLHNVHMHSFSNHLRYWQDWHLFTEALTEIILGGLSDGLIRARQKAVASSHSKWITQMKNWLAEGFKDVCVLRFCLFSLVLSTRGQSNCFSKVSLIFSRYTPSTRSDVFIQHLEEIMRKERRWNRDGQKTNVD